MILAGGVMLSIGCFSGTEKPELSQEKSEPAQGLAAAGKEGEPSSDFLREQGSFQLPNSATAGADQNQSDFPYAAESASAQQQTAEHHPFPLPDSWKRLGNSEIWVDFEAKQVILGGYICLERGLLEMFACPAGTKEHESVVAVLAPSVEMHAALLAVGAVAGKPSRWEEERGYIPPSGSKIDIQVRWLDEKTQEIISRDSRQMVQNSSTGEAMDYEWIFGGSVTFEDPETGERYYYANSGEMICVSNFPSAAIDIGIESSSENNELMFQVFSENVPPLGTKVYLILTPGEIRQGN